MTGSREMRRLPLEVMVELTSLTKQRGGKVNVGNVNELFLEVGAICALDLGEKRFWGVHEVAGGGDLVGGFLERTDLRRQWR